MKILVAEDFKTTRRAQIRMLSELGYGEILEAGDGEAALQKLREEPDAGLIISDWNMPRCSGYDLLLAVRKDPKIRHIPFIIATAQGEIQQARKAIAAGANAFITKPFTREELGAALADVLRAQSPKETISAVPRIRIAHLQITDHLVLGALVHQIREGQVQPERIEIEPRCMSSWNPAARALETGEVDGALILAPLALDMFANHAKIKLILFAHRSGSTCVCRRRQGTDQGPYPDQETLHNLFKGKTFLLPHTLSIHHILSDIFLREIGLRLGPVGRSDTDVFYEVVPPLEMPRILAEEAEVSGFAVAEPYGTQAVDQGVGELLFHTDQLWENHPCCVLAVREDWLEKHEAGAQELVRLLVEAGAYMAEHPENVQRIALEFLDPDGDLGLTPEMLKRVLQGPSKVCTDDLFPDIADLERMQRYMTERMDMGITADLSGFVETKYAAAAYGNRPIEKRISKMKGVESILARIICRRFSRTDQILSPAEPAPEPEPKTEPETEPETEERVSDPAVEGAEFSRFHIEESHTDLRMTFASEMALVDRAVLEAKDFLKTIGFETFSGFNLILRELLINAVEHGNRNDPEKGVSCTVQQVRKNLFRIIVEDQGEGFDPKDLRYDLPKDAKSLRRRGYPFIHAFAEKIEFNNRGNRVTVYHEVFGRTDFPVEKAGDRVIIRPTGDITAASVPIFGELLKKLARQGHTAFCFDLGSVREIDSVGLSAFIVLEKMLSKAGKRPDLEIIGAAPDLAELFCLINLGKLYHIHEAASEREGEKG